MTNLSVMAVDLMQIFKWGVDYGLLLAEQERDSEDLADAFQGVVIDDKIFHAVLPCEEADAPQRQLEEGKIG